VTEIAEEQHQAALPDIVSCFTCSARYTYRGRRGELNGRFCSMRCQDWFDAGGRPFGRPDEVSLIGWKVVAGSPGLEVNTDYYATILGRAPVPIKRTAEGFEIVCGGCGETFESKGWRFCDEGCASRFHDREANLAKMAEVGMEPAVKRKCEKCGGNIPRYRGVGKARREVRKDARFCSPRCTQNARMRENA
jgi:ribosomal protein L24E